MSQRQLAQASGVDHSTISRLVRGDRTPSLGTATKLARGLREIREDADAPQYLGLVSGGATMNPTARVEYALRADDALGEAQVRQVMEYFLAVRMRRYARPVGPPTARPTYPPMPARQGVTALASVVGGSSASDRSMLAGSPSSFLIRRPPSR
jgi:transcriptional regulator with XRE-family HTH domain